MTATVPAFWQRHIAPRWQTFHAGYVAPAYTTIEPYVSGLYHTILDNAPVSVAACLATCSDTYYSTQPVLTRVRTSTDRLAIEQGLRQWIADSAHLEFAGQANVQEAARRIRASLNDQTDILDLSGLRLDSIPKCIGNLRHLKDVNLSRNNLTYLPASLFDLSHLTILNVSNNQLSNIPVELGQARTLEELNIAGNPIRPIANPDRTLSWMGQLENLTLLTVDPTLHLPQAIRDRTDLGPSVIENALHQWATEVPAEAYNRANAEQLILIALRAGNATDLDLHGLNLSSLPKCLGQLITLQSLNLQGNALTAVPQEIRSLRALTNLNLSGNQIREIPDWVPELVVLTTLDFSKNLLTAVPPTVLAMPTLTNLNLKGNKIAVATPEIRLHYKKVNMEGNSFALSWFSFVISLYTALAARLAGTRLEHTFQNATRRYSGAPEIEPVIPPPPNEEDPVVVAHDAPPDIEHGDAVLPPPLPPQDDGILQEFNFFNEEEQQAQLPPPAANLRLVMAGGADVHERDRVTKNAMITLRTAQAEQPLTEAAKERAVQEFTAYVGAFETRKRNIDIGPGQRRLQTDDERAEETARKRILALHALVGHNERAFDRDFPAFLGVQGRWTLNGLELTGEEIIARLWRYTETRQGRERATVREGMFNALVESIDRDRRVCNPGKANRLALAVLQGRLPGVNLNIDLAQPMPVGDALTAFLRLHGNRIDNGQDNAIDNGAKLHTAAIEWLNANGGVERGPFLLELAKYARTTWGELPESFELSVVDRIGVGIRNHAELSLALANWLAQRAHLQFAGDAERPGILLGLKNFSDTLWGAEAPAVAIVDLDDDVEVENDNEEEVGDDLENEEANDVLPVLVPIENPRIAEARRLLGVAQQAGVRRDIQFAAAELRRIQQEVLQAQ